MMPIFRASAPERIENTDKSDPAARLAKQQRIGLFGFMGAGNFGNKASLIAALSFLRAARPNSEFICIAVNPDRVSAMVGVDAMAINWRPKSAFGASLDRWLFKIPSELVSIGKALWRCWRLDVLLIPGTGILDDFGTGWRGMPYWLFRWCILARLCGTKVLFVSIGAGPIYHPISRWLMRTAAEQADYRSYRDTISRNYMASLGTDVSSDPVYPDVVFALPHAKAPMPSRQKEDPIVVGIGVMSYNGWRGDTARNFSVYKAYMNTLEDFAKWVLAQGHSLRIFMGDDQDRDALDELAKRLRRSNGGTEAGAVHVANVRSLWDVCAEIAQCDVVVATRFHNVVAALALHRPVLSIGYAKKNDALLTQAGMSELCQHIEQLDLERLKEQFTLMHDQRVEFSESARKMSDAFAEQLRVQNERLLAEYF